MSEELQDEVTSINSIYDGNVLSPLTDGEHLYALTLPAQRGISLRLEFSPNYPESPPSVLSTEHVGEEIAKGEGTSIVELVRVVLSEVFAPGVPCIFDLLEETATRLQQLGLHEGSKDEKQQATQTNGQDASDLSISKTSDDVQPMEDLGDPPPWALSEVIVEKKSIFVARAAPVCSVEQAKSYLAHLLATDKKVAKATHNMTAWRVRGEHGVQYQDCDDDGEDAAGGRLLHLLELMNVWNSMVVVSRWYGGVKLGPDRFRLINQCARDAIVRGGLAPTDEVRDGGKKRGKR